MGQLTQALEKAQAGHGEIVAVVGEPGWANRDYFTSLLILIGWSLRWSWKRVRFVREGDCLTSVIDLLKAYFEVEDRDDSTRLREKVTGKLLILDR
jgi:hypothetical protein